MFRHGIPTLILFSLILGWQAKAPAAVGAVTGGSGSYVLPMSCAELLPDPGPFIGFFESVARSQVSHDRPLSRSMYRVLALRGRLAEEAESARDQNPIDVLVRRTLCFYREQTGPAVITYDDPKIVQFLKSSIKELETKVDDIIFQSEFERQERVEYKRQLEKNRGVADVVRKEAENDADREYERLASAARRKARLQQ